MDKKLYRSPRDGIILGIASGLGHYFDKDPVLVRIIFVIAAFLTKGWPIILLYAVLFFIIPVDPAQANVEQQQEPKDVTASEPVKPEEKQRGEPAADTPADGAGGPTPEERSEGPENAERTEGAEELERMDGSQNM